MYEKTYGSKYHATQDLRRVEIAKLIRADIKAAVKSGELPEAKYAVRCSRGRGINVEVSGGLFPVLSREYFALRPDHQQYADKHWSWRVTPKDRPACERYTAEARTVRDAVAKLVAAYNYDGSEIETDYFDVRFYSSVDIAEDGLSLVAYLIGEEMAPEIAAALAEAS